MNQYKPKGYNSLSPYLVVNNAQRLVTLLINIFQAKELRRFDREDGTIEHTELQLDDSIIMISDSTKQFPPHKTMLHMYVTDVFKTFELAIENGCEAIDKPINKENDPDIRGSFYDYAGNYWAIGAQNNE